MPIKGKNTLSIADKSAETGTMTFCSAILTAGNFAGQETDRDDLIVKLMALVLGDQQRVQFGNLNTLLPSGHAATAGQREIKLEIQWFDTVTLATSSNELPTYNDTFNLPGSDEVDTAGAEWIAMVTAFELFVLSSAGNPVQITGGRLVGRNI